MGKNTPRNLFLFRYWGVFLSRWVRISTNTARIITRLYIGNLGQRRLGSDFFLIKIRLKLFSLIFRCTYIFSIHHPSCKIWIAKEQVQNSHARNRNVIIFNNVIKEKTSGLFVVTLYFDAYPNDRQIEWLLHQMGERIEKKRILRIILRKVLQPMSNTRNI